MTDLIDPWEPENFSEGSAASEGSDGLIPPPGEPSEIPPEDGARLFDDVREWLARHIVVMRPGDLDLLTVWAAHTHLVERLYTTPRLQIDSPVPESGKTTVLEHLERLTYHPLQASSIGSAALLTRVVGEEPRTLLLDEVDRTLDPKKEGVGELLAILNTGYKVGGSRPTLVNTKGKDWDVKVFSTFAPVVLAGNQPALPDDTRTRIVRVLLLPDWQGVAEESDWELIDAPARELGARLALWALAADVTPRPDLPEGVTGRFREKWLPLARVARAAGGEWLERVRDLATADVEQVRQDREEGLAVQKPAVLLLRHIVELWPSGETFWRTEDVAQTLAYHHPEVWGAESSFGKALTTQRLGRMLTSSYSIRVVPEDSADKYSRRGYRRDQFGAAVAALTARSEAAPRVTPTPPGEPSEPPEAPEPSERASLRSLPDSQASQASTDPHVSESGPTGPTGHDLHKHSGPTAQSGQSGHAESNGPTAVPTAPPTPPWTDGTEKCTECGDPLDGPALMSRCAELHTERRTA